MADPDAADPLADVRAHHDDCDAEWCATHGLPHATCSHGCEVFVLLAALDDERGARERQVDALVRELKRVQDLHARASYENTALRAARDVRKAALERAEAAIARAPRLLEVYVQVEAGKHREQGTAECSCGFCVWSPDHVAIMAARDAWPRVVAALETETPA